MICLVLLKEENQRDFGKSKPLPVTTFVCCDECKNGMTIGAPTLACRLLEIACWASPVRDVMAGGVGNNKELVAGNGLPVGGMLADWHVSSDCAQVFCSY